MAERNLKEEENDFLKFTKNEISNKKVHKYGLEHFGKSELETDFLAEKDDDSDLDEKDDEMPVNEDKIF